MDDRIGHCSEHLFSSGIRNESGAGTFSNLRRSAAGISRRSMRTTLSYKRFPAPVRVIIKQSQENIIATAWDAVEFLRRWPGRRGIAYRRALQHCLDALDGIRSPQKAWASFTAAMKEEGLLA
jgi:NAD-dependent DNA ligase